MFRLYQAIPFIGKDLVESTKKISTLPTGGVVIKREVLPSIGTVNKNALKKGRKELMTDKKEYLSIPSSFIAFLVGFIDGDGYIQITKTTKGYIAIKLVISLHLNDLSTLEYIRSVLKIGKITIYKDYRSPTCKLIINKTDLQEVLFPLLVHHEIYFLTLTRSDQFNRVMYILQNNIILFEEVYIKNNIPKFSSPKTALEYSKLDYFKNWLVGFTMAEGSFLVKKNKDCCFQLKQRLHIELFEAFKLVFKTTRKIESVAYSQFSVSSKEDIQEVINFFSFTGLHPLVGLKCIKYFNWLNSLKTSLRYKDLHFPGSVL